MSHKYSSFRINNFGSPKSFLALLKIIICIWLWEASYDWINDTHIWVHCNDVIHSIQKQITFKTT